MSEKEYYNDGYAAAMKDTESEITALRTRIAELDQQLAEAKAELVGLKELADTRNRLLGETVQKFIAAESARDYYRKEFESGEVLYSSAIAELSEARAELEWELAAEAKKRNVLLDAFLAVEAENTRLKGELADAIVQLDEANIAAGQWQDKWVAAEAARDTAIAETEALKEQVKAISRASAGCGLLLSHGWSKCPVALEAQP